MRVATTLTTAVAIAGLGLLASPTTAHAAQDTACKKAGMKTLQSARLLDDVARDGIALSTAVSLGVAPRDPALDLSTVPDPIPLPLLLADHRAGADSLFVYPWC